MNRTGIKKMLTTTVLAAMAMLLVFSASAVCDIVDPVEVDVDIKPGSDENPINVKSKGVLSVAVLGTAAFDVTTIDPETIRLNGTVLNETCAPIRWSYEDVDGYGDGYTDLVLKFETQEVVDCLPDEDGAIVTLTLTGELYGLYSGTPITGDDNVQVLNKSKGK